MPVFRGNVGNLLQHWVLCEILEAWQSYAHQIDFMDAHSMAPLADERYWEKGLASRRGSAKAFVELPSGWLPQGVVSGRS